MTSPSPAAGNAVPLSGLEAWNFRAIQHLKLTLHPRLNVLIGENGAGKTSVMEAVAAGLGAIAGRIPGGHNLTISSLQIRRKYGRQVAFAGVRLSANGISWTRVLQRDKTQQASNERHRTMGRIQNLELHKRIDPQIYAVGEDPSASVALPLTAFYGTERAVVGIPLRDRKFSSEQSRFDAFKHCLGATTNFRTMFEWFLARELWEAHEQRERPEWSDPALAVIRRAVELAVPRAQNLRVAQAPIRMLVDMVSSGGVLNTMVVQNLSGGQRIMLAMVADLARRMVEANPHLGLNTPAVVLIDEVDLHLHPRWQATVLDTLLEIFPQTQFIVTTHSEQIVSSVPSECVARLEDSSEGICVHSIGDVRGATWDETLQDSMGLETDRPAEPARLLERLWELVQLDLGDSGEARGIMQKVRDEYHGAISELARVQFEVRRREGLAKLRQDRR